MHFFFSFLCHQIPGRSPHLDASVFPLCYRCAGLYLGMLGAYAFLALGGGLRRTFPATPSLVVAISAMAPFIVDGIGNKFGVWDTPGLLRSLSGVAYGVALPLLLVPAAGAGLSSRVHPPTLAQPAGIAVPLATGFILIMVLTQTRSVLVFDALAFPAFAGFAAFALNLLVSVSRLRRLLRSRDAGASRFRP